MGEQVPALGLGTWLLSGKQCTQSIAHALILGYRHIDTAQDYGNESEVGKGIQNAGIRREDLFLVTKVRPSNFSYRRTIQTTHASLQRLHTNYVDLLLMHWPNPSIPLQETLSAMVKLQEEGSVRHIGVSNFPPAMVEEAAQYATIFCNQVEYHPYLSQDKLLTQAKRMGYLLTAYSPLAKGRVLGDPTLKQISDTYRKTPIQVTLRWLIQQGIAAIPKAGSTKHIETNLDIFDFELSNEEMLAIHALNRELRLDPVSVMARE